MKAKPNRKTVRAAIRGAVPEGRLRKAKIVLSDAAYGKQHVTGFTEYDNASRKGIVKIGTPAGDDAMSITVRGHETRHATRTQPQRRKPMTAQQAQASQIVDDINVETLALPTAFSGSGLEDYRRAHIATAMKDLQGLVIDERKMRAGKIPNSYELRNNRLLAGLRIKAMLAHYRDGANPRTVKQAIKGAKKIRDIVGPDTSKAMHKIIELAKSRRNRNKAISMLSMLLESAPVEEGEEPPELPEMKPDENGELMPVTHGDALEGKMLINDLRPKSAYTAKERAITQRYAPDGVHLNPNRYVAAIVEGNANGLFSRRLRQKAGGTVVIDASGSMGATAQNLTQLAQKVPTATIAYYSGNDAGKGVLAIYAQKGKRYAGELPNDTLQGGNAVDLAAVRWLFEQPKPWTLVSDLEFTGGVLGSEVIAHSLVERAVQRGELIVYESLDAAYEAFGGKGVLGDAKANPEFIAAMRERRRIRARRHTAKHPSSFAKR